MAEETQQREILFSLSKEKGDFIVKFSTSQGKGGQNVNRRSTKATITHPASGAQAYCQVHRSQKDNKREAFRRLLETPKFKTWLRIELARRGVETQPTGQQGPTGSRGEKIRTYNAPRDEVKDHRTGTTISGINRVLDGDLDQILDDLLMQRREECLNTTDPTHKP